MVSELINKLKKRKQKLQNLKDVYIKGSPAFDITITKENSVFKMQISDYISITDYIKRMNLIDKFRVIDLISNGVLWNSKKQKVNKGIYYVLIVGNRLYNVFIDGDKLGIDERIKIDDIIEERIIQFNKSDSDYHYFYAKHDKNYSTSNTRYYNKKESYFGNLDFSKDEVYDEINNVILNLESVEEITKIIDVDLLKKNILNDIGIETLQRKNML